MIYQNIDPRLVEAVEEFKKALSIYDRALFYFDGLQAPDLPVNSRIAYAPLIADLESILNDPKINQNQRVNVALHRASIETLRAYYDAWHALLNRIRRDDKIYKRLIERAERRKINLIDRKFSNAKQSVDDLAKKYAAVVRRLLDYLKEDSKNNNWCRYSIEFDMLYSRCDLLADEIQHRNKRTQTISDSFLNLDQFRNARTGLLVAIIGILIGTLFSGANILITLFRGDPPIVINNAPAPSARAELSALVDARLSALEKSLLEANNDKEMSLNPASIELLKSYVTEWISSNQIEPCKADEKFQSNLYFYYFCEDSKEPISTFDGHVFLSHLGGIRKALELVEPNIEKLTKHAESASTVLSDFEQAIEDMDTNTPNYFIKQGGLLNFNSGPKEKASSE